MEAQTMEEKLGKSYAGLTKVCFVYSKLYTLFFSWKNITAIKTDKICNNKSHKYVCIV